MDFERLAALCLRADEAAGSALLILAATTTLLMAAGLLSRRPRASPASASGRECMDLAETERARSYPDAYPNGWYKIADSDDLKKGQVRHVRCLGREFVVFRGERSGRAFVLDAHCPHMGANLAVGGRVIGDCLECPFHKWVFDGNGCVQHIPYAPRVPRVGTRSWPVRNYHDMICIYHEPSNPSSLPPYELPVVEGITTGEFRFRGRRNAGDVRMHLIEFAENSVDHQHFQPLHGRMRIPWTRVPLPFVGIEHQTSWRAHDEVRHCALFEDTACLKVFGRPLPQSGAHATITLPGPGGIVIFRIDIPRLGQILLFQTHTPLEPLRQRVQFRWYASRRIPRLLVSYVVGNWLSQWREDIKIWENKVYRSRPLLVQEDGPVHQMRAWYRQFLSEEGLDRAREDTGARADEKEAAEPFGLGVKRGPARVPRAPAARGSPSNT